MQEKTIYKISLLVIIIGLSFLYFYAGEFNLAKVGTLDQIQAEEQVLIEGVIKKLSVQEKATFLEVEGQRKETLNIVLFNDQDLYLKEGNFVEVSGVVEEYDGEKEIIADQIQLIR